MFGILLIIGLLVLIGSFWKDIIPAGADFLSVIIGAIGAWYAFWGIIGAISG